MSSSLGTVTRTLRGDAILQGSEASSSVAPTKISVLVDSKKGDAITRRRNDVDVTVHVPSTRLYRWNVAMFLFHTALAGTTLAMSNLDLAGPIYASDLEFVEAVNMTNATLAFMLLPSYRALGSLPLSWLVVAFFLCSAVAHFGNAFVWRGFYEYELARCRVTTRWVEYFFSAPIMILSIAYGAGVREYTLLFAVALLIASTMPFGYLTELVAEPASETQWTRSLRFRLAPHFLGYVPQLAAWGVILVNFYDQSYPANRSPPWFVTLIILVELGLFFSFGVVQMVQQCMSPRWFATGEVVYQWLSLISKGLLGMLILSNVLVLDRFEDIYES